MNTEKHDQEKSEKKKDLCDKDLGKNEKEQLVLDNSSYLSNLYI